MTVYLFTVSRHRYPNERRVAQIEHSRKSSPLAPVWVMQPACKYLSGWTNTSSCHLPQKSPSSSYMTRSAPGLPPVYTLLCFSGNSKNSPEHEGNEKPLNGVSTPERTNIGWNRTQVCIAYLVVVILMRISAMTGKQFNIIEQARHESRLTLRRRLRPHQWRWICHLRCTIPLWHVSFQVRFLSARVTHLRSHNHPIASWRRVQWPRM